MLMILGYFIFERTTLSPATADRALNIATAKQARFQGRPAVQFTGIDSETLKLAGVIYPKSKITGTSANLDQVRDMAQTGESFLLAGASGDVEGMFMIQGVTGKTTQYDKAGTPLKIEFGIDLIRTDDDRVFKASE